MKKADIQVGMRCIFRSENSGWRVGTVRSTYGKSFPDLPIRVDDGDPLNADPVTNKASLMAWVSPQSVKPFREEVTKLMEERQVLEAQLKDKRLLLGAATLQKQEAATALRDTEKRLRSLNTRIGKVS